MIQVIQHRPSALENVGANIGAGLGAAVEQYYTRKNKERTIDEILEKQEGLTDDQKSLFKGVFLEDIDPSALASLAKFKPQGVKGAYLDKVPGAVQKEMKILGLDPQTNPDQYQRISKAALARAEEGQPLAYALPEAIQEDIGKEKARGLVPKAPAHRFDYARPLLGAVGQIGQQEPQAREVADIQKAIPSLQEAAQTLSHDELVDQLTKQGWSPNAIASLMKQEPAPELLSAQGQAEPEAVGDVLTPNDQATMAAIEPGAIPAEDRADLMEAPEEPPEVTAARERVQALAPEDIDPENMPIADLLALSGEQFNTLPFAKKAAISKRIGEEAESGFNRELLAGLTLGGSERARREMGEGGNVVAGEGGKQTARMLGQAPYFAAANLIPGGGAILGSAKIGGTFAALDAAERFIEHGKPTSLAEFEKTFGTGMALDLILRGTGKLARLAINKFIKGGTPRNDPKLKELVKAAQEPKSKKKPKAKAK
jgi:hypothetical protein